MASLRTLQETVQWAMSFTKLIPIIGASGYENEPALTICNNVIQQMLAYPYNWKFNSQDAAPFNTDTTANTQDYVNTITDCAWVESCVRLDPNSTQQPPPIENIEVVRNIQPTSIVSNPSKIAYMNENDGGGIWRIWPVAGMGKEWTLMPVYQRKPLVKMGLQETWAPFPDELAYVYNQGFLAFAYKHADDPRWEAEYKNFLYLIQTALNIKDAEGNAEGFTPDFGLFVG
jgi:hypothetical protein